LIKQGTSSFFYSNVRLIQKNIHAKYVGCTHEYLNHESITTQLNTLFINDINDGGCKSNKYERDIELLIKGIENEPNNTRYYFYLANSYKDSMQYEKSISTYEKVLELNGWSQEKYYSCHKLFECCSQIGNIERGLYYLTTSYMYDDERSECMYELIKFYCAKKMDAIAMKYYELIKDKYETSILTTTFQGKLFVTASIPYFYLPYYVIIVSINMKSYKTAMLMYEIIFKKKQMDINKWWISNVMFNYRFVKDMISDNGFSHLRELYKSYVNFLSENNYNIREVIPDLDYELDSELDSDSISSKNNYYSNIVKSLKYKKSKKILFYVGYSLPHYKWNKTISLTSPMGGSEKALSYLIDLFPKCYDIYVCGDVVEEQVDNIHFIHSDKLKELVEKNEFHSVIMSRYIELIINHKFKCYNLYIWVHDRIIRSLSFTNNDAVEIINNCIDKIDGCICLTNWHKEYISKLYSIPELQPKIFTINNGIEINNFPKPDTKIKNTFIYTSRSERGLKRVLELWESLSKNITDAHLSISSYNVFPDPINKDDIMIEREIKKYSNITHLGRLNEKELYSLMNRSEYWLYPSDFYETSCITAMEMLKSRVICLYYPIGGVVDTINNHGVKLVKDQEVNQILSLIHDDKHKQKMVIEGEKYADTCSWENRYKQWEDMLFNDSCDDSTGSSLKYTIMSSSNKNIKNSSSSSSHDITLITAFFDIGRGKWSKFTRSTECYINSFIEYFNYDYKMIVFIDDRYIDEVIEKISKMNSTNIANKTLIPINYAWLDKNIYSWKQMESVKRVMSSDYYKNICNSRIKNGYPENIYAEYNLINISKIDFICYAINNSLITGNIDTNFICWTDFGYFSSILNNNIDNFPSTSLDIKYFNTKKINFCLRNKLNENDKDYIHTLLNATETFTGTFWGANSKNMKIFQTLVHNEVNEMIKNNIFDDDQHIYLRCFLKNPSSFDLYLSDNKWPDGLNYFEKISSRHEIVCKYIKNITNGIFVEIGTDKGEFADFILSSNNSCVLYCVDPYTKYDEYNDAINNITGDKLYESVKTKLTYKYGNRIKFIRKFSHDAIDDIPNNIDFVYIDGNHSYNYVYQDIKDWYSKIKSNGIIIGDDAVDDDNTKRDEKNNVYIEWVPGCYGEYGVIKAFEDFTTESPYSYKKLINNQFILRK